MGCLKLAAMGWTVRADCGVPIWKKTNSSKEEDILKQFCTIFTAAHRWEYGRLSAISTVAVSFHNVIINTKISPSSAIPNSPINFFCLQFQYMSGHLRKQNFKKKLDVMFLQLCSRGGEKIKGFVGQATKRNNEEKKIGTTNHPKLMLRWSGVRVSGQIKIS